MAEVTININFEDNTVRKNGRDWHTIPIVLARYILCSDASVIKTISDKTVKEREECVWWHVLDINDNEVLWMNNDDGEMVIINNKEDTAYYTNF